ncbi:phosphorylase [Nostoc sp. FACHB-152]|uniref:5'-methylthioadenosine/S-adenosylhomocysteine nucleosidase family protein n=1 Tax=unclassified Nostoc TaxID=2593658 RepID=UPI0016859030|nr:MULTISPECIES: phosphorylase [unclassified Nostoc]MBD2448237.1 phosphorylase [Nostoc sp. FACHB-152]MBD2469258.1 phosphorylase [Nostoc sp. FACHB-145]
MINTILVPQGAEYQAVCRGLSQVTGLKPDVLSIPVGIKPLTQYLKQWQQQPSFFAQIPQPMQIQPENKSSLFQPQVLVMGLCGSLSQRYTVGDIVLYQNCTYQGQIQECDQLFTTQLYSRLRQQVSLVKGLTSDRVIWSAKEKRHLGELFEADVVDMESFAALEFFEQIGIAATVIRVVSDDCQRDIPNLTSAISADGSLQTLPLAWRFIRQPIAATRLIRGSLQGLKVLEKLIPSLIEGNRE